MTAENLECSCSICTDYRAAMAGESPLTLQARQERVNAEQWLDVAKAREAQEKLPKHYWVEPFIDEAIVDRWWFRFLVGLAIVICLCSLYVLSCGANPFGGCTL